MLLKCQEEAYLGATGKCRFDWKKRDVLSSAPWTIRRALWGKKEDFLCIVKCCWVFVLDVYSICIVKYCWVFILDVCSICITLQWRHNECNGVSNHQPHDCLLSHLFRWRSKKTSKLCVTGLCGGNSQVTGEFPAQRASNAENVSIWWCRHGEILLGSELDVYSICILTYCWVSVLDVYIMVDYNMYGV